MISAVIPVYNEMESLGELHGELDEVAREHGCEMEIIFVDDGSTDESWEKIEGLAADDPRVRGVRFRRNFGKAAALSAGFQEGWDVVLLLKALPCFERQQTGASEAAVTRFPDAWVVTSFPTKSLRGKEKGMPGHYAGIARTLADRTGRDRRTLALATETFHIFAPRNRL